MVRHSKPEAFVLAGVLSLALLLGPAHAQAPTASGPAGASGATDTKAGTKPDAKAEAKPEAKADPTEEARAVLKEMSKALSSAGSLTFHVRSLIPMKLPTGGWITLVGAATVMRQGRDKLHVDTGGDLFPFTLYFDGKTVTAFAAKENVYAQREAPGTIDEMLERAAKRGEAVFVFGDLVSADPYAAMTRGLQSAKVVGTSMVDGVETQHLAVHGKKLDWEIWIGTKDRLPRLVTLTDIADAHKPTQTVQLTQWALDERLPPDAFAFKNPGDATQVPFRSPEQAKGEAAGRRVAPTHRP
jgi:hypothetical protein